ncbi:hypothetical protein ACLOJK_028473 [Asimina triloba]
MTTLLDENGAICQVRIGRGRSHSLQNRKGEIAFTAESEGGDRPDCRIDENSHSLQNRKGEIGRRRMAGGDRKEETGRGRSEKGDGAGETGPGGGRGRSEMADGA